MSKINFSLIIERLHAAAVGVEGWEPALQAFAEATGSRSAQLCGLQADELLFNVITNIDPSMTQILAETAADNPRVPVANTVPVLSTMADGDFLTVEQHRRHPFYRQVCWPWDVPYVCLTALQRTDEMSVVLAAIRSRDDGHISTTQRSYFAKLARHAQSAVGVHMALERRGAVLMAGALEALRCAAFICDRRGYVRAMTPAGEQLVSGEGQLVLRGHVLCARDEESTKRLHDAMRAAGAHRAATDRFLKRSVRVGFGAARAANMEIFALPEQPYELPFWPTVLVVVRDQQERDGVALAAPAAAAAAAAAAAPSATQRLNVAAHGRAQRAESALDAVTSAAFLLDSAGRVVHHNAAAESLLRLEDGLQLRDQRLYTTDPLLHGKLHSLIVSAASASAALLPPSAGAIAVPRPSGRRSLQVMVRPLRLPDASPATHVLVVIGDPDRAASYPEVILSSLYGLTRAEVEVANALLAGQTIGEIAEQRRVTTGTLRIQMKSIFLKTDTRRQSDLLRLLLSLPVVPP